MDNLTHSLVGAALAQGAIQYRMARARRRSTSDNAAASSGATEAALASEAASPARAAAATGIATLPMYVTSILANNFPDSDLVVTALMDPRLGYILHHRGHTHTLLFVPLQLLLLLSGLWLYQRWRKPGWSAEDWRWFAGLAFVGGVVHMGMDSWNVYGVHPFWPLNNRWFYGDFVFILEPLIWIALIPWIYTSVAQRWSRNLLTFCYSVGFVGLFVLYYRTWWYPLVVLVLGLSFGAWIRSRQRLSSRGWGTLAAMVVVLGSLLGSSLWLRGTLHDALHRQAPSERVTDIALMSYPSNPLCYQWVSVAHDRAKGDYVLRKGIFSFAPTLLPCPSITQGGTAKLVAAKASFAPAVGGAIGTQQVFRRPLNELKALAGHCQLEAALQFIRTPYWEISRHHFLIGDLRFDRRKEFDLAEFVFRKKPLKCPKVLPPWVPPLRSQGLW